jgi:hypothetical protein
VPHRAELIMILHLIDRLLCDSHAVQATGGGWWAVGGGRWAVGGGGRRWAAAGGGRVGGLRQANRVVLLLVSLERRGSGRTTTRAAYH